MLHQNKRKTPEPLRRRHTTSAPDALARMRGALAEALQSGLDSLRGSVLNGHHPPPQQQQPNHNGRAVAALGAQQNGAAPHAGHVPAGPNLDAAAAGGGDWRPGMPSLFGRTGGGPLARARRQQQLYLDLRPFMDMGPTTVRSDPSMTGFRGLILV